MEKKLFFMSHYQISQFFLQELLMKFALFSTTVLWKSWFFLRIDEICDFFLQLVDEIRNFFYEQLMEFVVLFLPWLIDEISSFILRAIDEILGFSLTISRNSWQIEEIHDFFLWSPNWFWEIWQKINNSQNSVNSWENHMHISCIYL